MKIHYIVYLLLSIIMATSCERFLDENSSNVNGMPNSLKDLRYILDYEVTNNQFYPSTMESSADDYYLAPQGFAGLRDIYQNMYTWEDQGTNPASWISPYKVVTAANVVIESLERLKGGSAELRKELEGEALFLRGTAFFYLAQSYAQPYRWNKESNSLGIVLRMDSDLEVNIKRSTLEETYRQLLTDLHRALGLLPASTPYLTRPSKASAAGMLARVYLMIENYEQALAMVELALSFNSKLLDYNSLDSLKQLPFTWSDNPELSYIGYSISAAYNLLNSNSFIPQEVYDLYEDADLRKVMFFQKASTGIKFKGYYHGIRVGYFSGIAVDELYLIKAECLARKKEIDLATQHLNDLLRMRYKKTAFVDLKFADEKELLKRILLERRKELIHRGLRWMDLRRLNVYPEYAVTLHRSVSIGGKLEEYTLEPNSLKYTFLVPLDAVSIGGYEQNSR